jgi:release factor glutamine methyltransferase
MTLAQAQAAAAGLGLARLDAQLLLLHALGRPESDRAWLLAHDTDAIDGSASEAFTSLCTRRAGGEPLAYIVGHKEFFGLDLRVDARVLVPRPETEALVEWAIELIEDGARVIDLGTGSGAIALAIKSTRPHAVVEGVDASAGALEVARGNAQRLSLDVQLHAASWLDGSHGHYDLIVTNPPYVAESDPHLAALKHEPVEALVAGPDGLREIRTIVARAMTYLNSAGWLLLEHGYDQGAAVRELLAGAGFGKIATRHDLAGIERCSGGQWLELG